MFSRLCNYVLNLKHGIPDIPKTHDRKIVSKDAIIIVSHYQVDSYEVVLIIQ